MNTPSYIVLLQTILKAHNLSQTELAKELGVTHAALNRWLHQKAVPHISTLKRIEAMYQKYAFHADLEASCDIRSWQKKFSKLKKKNGLEELLRHKDIFEDSLLKLTYHTNRIEGSTLSLHETQSILFDNQVIPKHSMLEHLEVSNHRLAFQKIIEALQNKMPLTLAFVLELHEILMRGILTDAGHLRNHSVRIVGARVIPPNHLKVAEKLNQLCLQMEVTSDPVGIIMQHALFEAIHPFSDGNGRIGRLLLNYQLLRTNMPLIIIHAESKRFYYQALEQAQVEQKFEPLVEFLYKEFLENSYETSS